LAKGVSEATYAGDGPHRTGHDRVQADAAPAGVQRADLAIHQSPRLGLAHHRRQGSAAKNEALFARIEHDFGVERGTLLALWGVESAYGDPLVQQNHMRPVFPSLAALAWNEPRRRAYWEAELINALKIVDRGWSTPEEMRGSWAGAMGHTQWMPEVWLNVGMDYDGDGRVSPFGKPDDALGSTARFLVNRGNYHRGEHWGYEVRAPALVQRQPELRGLGERRRLARRRPAVFATRCASAQMWVPVPGGPAFLLGPNFYAVRSYNPSMNYALAICHLGDRILGGPPFIQPFPGSERALTLAEVQEMQTRLTKAGFDTGGTDGRVGNDTMQAIRDYQIKEGLLPADGYEGAGALEASGRLHSGARCEPRHLEISNCAFEVRSFASRSNDEVYSIGP
jgi:membrane-bound lytic murein transglycosylase B